MKAKTINEFNFERGQDPKSSMEIGGINFGEEFNNYYNKWYNNIKSSIEGKNIIAVVTEYYVKNKINHPINERKKTIMGINNVKGPWVQSSNTSKIFFTITFRDSQGILYSMELNQKIHIF